MWILSHDVSFAMNDNGVLIFLQCVGRGKNQKWELRIDGHSKDNILARYPTKLQAQTKLNDFCVMGGTNTTFFLDKAV